MNTISQNETISVSFLQEIKSKVKGLFFSILSDSKGILYLWTINAKPVGRLETTSRINCLAFSALHDGIAINVVAAGLNNGNIQ